MNDCMIRQGFTGLSVDLKTHLHWVEEPMTSSILDPSVESFNPCDCTWSSDSEWLGCQADG